jgi:hypothetical protein
LRKQGEGPLAELEILPTNKQMYKEIKHISPSKDKNK